MRRRTFVIGGLGAAGLTGAATMAYRQAPSFWRQFAAEWNRPINPPEHRPHPREWPDTGLHAAWLGHATVLMKIDGVTVITDPVFSNRVGIGLGPLTLGLKRLTAPAVKANQLPKIDLVLISHAHMDHLDVPSLRALESKDTRVIMASKTSDLIRAHRFREVKELFWGDEAWTGPLQVKAIEVNHWGARMRTDTWRGYNGYVLQAGRYRVLFAGDTANTHLFRNARGARPYDLAVMPIGAYNSWHRYHCNPEEAWRMGNEANAERFIPVHHQTFSLSREPLMEPIERFHAAAANALERIAVDRIGEEVHV
jgi:L-ascorbate metabolism protein UlaG (beta-lactamase superfamily)